jgi:ferritin-like metal-binding protein YciE
LLEATLKEEKNCDGLLTQIAEGGINETAKTEKE